jgi:hypothetical protein
MRPATGRSPERGQVIVLLALATVIVLGMLAVALDGSYGLVQERRDQNGADFATLAGAQELRSWCLTGTALPSDHQVYTAIQSVINQNASNVASWQATYLDGSAPPRSTTYVVGSGPGGYPPANACGVSVQVNSRWPTFLGGIIGFSSGSTLATSAASNSPNLGSLASIYSIDPTGPHAILGGGSGTFVVSGDMYINTNTRTWAGTEPGYDQQTQASASLLYNDSLDAKGHSNIYIFGTIHSPDMPLDTCFGTGSSRGAPFDVPLAGQAVQYQSGVPISAQQANQAPPCNVLSPTVEYDGIDNSWKPRGDPLNPPTGGSLPDPLATGNETLGTCPGQPYPTYTSASQVPGWVKSLTTGQDTYPLPLKPGVYAYPMKITSSVDFADCLGIYDTSPSNNGTFPGLFRFPSGLQIDLKKSSDVVRGNNVMFATGNPLPIPGNVPGTFNSGTGVFTATGTGNGGPCVPYAAQSNDNGGTNRADADQSAAACPGTVGMYPSINYAVNTVPASRPPAGPDGTGSNFSVVIGGVVGSKVTLAPPYAGAFNQVLFFQNRTTAANYGFDAMPGDGATDNLTGLIYNASRPASTPFGFWDPTGIPFNSGGTLQAGYGITSNSGSGWNPSTSSSSVTVNGICIVDDFNTDGATDITILGTTYKFPNGGLGPSIVG